MHTAHTESFAGDHRTTSCHPSKDKSVILKRLKETGVVAVIRVDSADALLEVGDALVAGGVEFMEITLTTPGALEMIARCSSRIPKLAIGAGTVLDRGQAEEAIAAGASYIVSPITDAEVIATCNDRHTAVMPGALTPTEVYRAHNLGADVVKIFSAGIGGPAYFKDLKGPFPGIEIMPTGGVNLETGPEFIRCGACAIGVGGALVSPAMVRDRQFTAITRNARALVAAVKAARGIV